MDDKDVIIQDLKADNKKLTEELEAYRQLEEKMHEKFQGYINTETIVNSFIAFYDMQEVNEELAECLLLTNENAKKYKEYKQLEEQGLLHKFTCKVGDTVYEIMRGMIVPSMVTGFRLGKMMGEDEEEYEEDYEENTWYIQAENGMSSQSFPMSAVGKTYWLTREEAKAALEKMKNGHDE